MPKTKITKERVQNHMHYAKKLYIFGTIAVMLLSGLIFDVTRHVPSGEQLMQVALVASYADLSKLEDTVPELRRRAMERDERVEDFSFFSVGYSGNSNDDYYGAQIYVVQMMAGENDIWIQNAALTEEMSQSAALVKLDTLEGFKEFVQNHPDVGLMTLEDTAYMKGEDEPDTEVPTHVYAIDVGGLLGFNERGAYDIRGCYASIHVSTTDAEAAFETISDLFELFAPAQEG